MKPAQAKGKLKKGAPPVVGGKTFPKALPADMRLADKDMFNSLLPPGVRAVLETFHGRWRLFWKSPPKSRSLSWDLYTNEGAIKMLLKEAWADYTAKTGEACPFEGLVV